MKSRKYWELEGSLAPVLSLPHFLRKALLWGQDSSKHSNFCHGYRMSWVLLSGFCML